MTDRNKPLRKLNAAGQSVWCDHIHRGMLESGGLAAMIEDDDLRGVLIATICGDRPWSSFSRRP